VNATDTRDLVLRQLQDVAPDVEPELLVPDEPFQVQLDFDSIDFLRFISGLAEETGRDIPESDYEQLSTLDGAVAYFSA